MRAARVISALVLALSCAIGASACIQEPDTGPETLHTALETGTDEETATASDPLGEFGAGSIGGSDFGHLDLGGPLNPVGPTRGGPLNPTGACEEACYALLELDFARCRKLPQHQRQACWARAMESYALCIRDCGRNRGG